MSTASTPGGDAGDRLDVLEEDVEQLHQAVADLMQANGLLEASVSRVAGVLEAGGTTGTGGRAPSKSDGEDSNGEGGAAAGWWSTSATPEEWAALADWVDHLVQVILPGITPALAPCWPQHPGAVEDLAAAHAAWQRAVDSDELGFWIDRTLVGLVDRFGWWSTRYCKDGHQDEPRARGTNRTYLPT